MSWWHRQVQIREELLLAFAAYILRGVVYLVDDAQLHISFRKTAVAGCLNVDLTIFRLQTLGHLGVMVILGQGARLLQISVHLAVKVERRLPVIQLIKTMLGNGMIFTAVQ